MRLSDEQWFAATRGALSDLDGADVDLFDELVQSGALEQDGRKEHVYELQAGDLQESALSILTFLTTHRQVLMDTISLGAGALSIVSGLTTLWKKLRGTRDLGEEERRVIDCLARRLAEMANNKGPF